ncbi:major facilitator superfamily domain-containing protein [Stachybotrys elegans]|uniref:Major facilitator superfamily domain-containing protein n=1 Tax=Stachybotrys elegans TaxID=80388 RepID=A0A8K0SRR8_9HYPO|nr:major facilitator superfamily domain-containing protein [Stachybotrys elegans]
MSTSTSVELQTMVRPTDEGHTLATWNASSPPDTAALAMDDEAQETRHEFSLPPVDGGKDAWLFLAACFLLEALVWGFPFAFGIFQDYYQTHEPFRGSDNIAVIGTCAMGIMYLDAPLIMGLMRMYPRVSRWAPVTGLLIMCVALGLSSLSQTVTHLVLSQGILFAVGGSICYCPCIQYMDEWFVKRKGFAFGVMWSGTGLGGFSIPMLLEMLLSRYGFRTTLRVWAVALFLLTIPLVYFIKPRLPPSATTNIKPFQIGFMFKTTFLIYQAGNVLQSLGFFLPGIYLPLYARASLGAGSLTAATTVLAVNVASVFGCLAMGTLIDKLHVTTCILISTLGAMVGIFLFWGLATNLPVLYVFCVVYGLFAGSYSSTYPGIMRQLSLPSQSAEGGQVGTSFDPIMIFGFLAAGRGVGNVISGPLSEALIRGMPWQGEAAFGYGSGYGPLIAFTGITAGLGGASYLFKRVGWM